MGLALDILREVCVSSRNSEGVGVSSRYIEESGLDLDEIYQEMRGWCRYIIRCRLAFDIFKEVGLSLDIFSEEGLSLDILREVGLSLLVDIGLALDIHLLREEGLSFDILKEEG